MSVIGADINAAGPSGHFPLSESSAKGHERMTLLLLQNHADIEKECTAHKNATPVVIAAIMDRPRIVDILLKVSCTLCYSYPYEIAYYVLHVLCYTYDF